MIQFLETPRETPGQKDGWTLLATTGGPTSTTTVECHLKVKNLDCNVSLTKNITPQSACKKNSSLNKLILKIHQILGSSALNGCAYS